MEKTCPNRFRQLPTERLGGFPTDLYIHSPDENSKVYVEEIKIVPQSVQLEPDSSEIALTLNIDKRKDHNKQVEILPLSHSGAFLSIVFVNTMVFANLKSLNTQSF